MATRAAIPFLVAMMLLTGVCNTLLTKYQDNQCARDCHDPKLRAFFHQPVLQTAQMFVGEMGCWLVIGAAALYRRLSRKTASPSAAGYEAVSGTDADARTALPADDDDEDDEDYDDEDGGRPAALDRLIEGGDDPVKLDSTLAGVRILLLSLPAMCDICGTTLMNAGLLMVVPSIYQMTRGALVLFVGLFSVMFLGRRLSLAQWVSLVGVVVGVGIVGLAGFIWADDHHQQHNKAAAAADLVRQVAAGAADAAAAAVAASDPNALRAVVGVLLIAGAQVFTATQFVLEEWLLERSTMDPITVVGWEGIFGFSVTLLGMAVLHLVIGRTEAGRYGYFDMVEGWRQLTSKPELWVSSILIMISIGGFNFFGLSVTRSVSATARSTIDTCRTLFIWIVSLGLGWETFKWLQVVGFALLVYFTFLFNGVVSPPLKCLEAGVEEEEELLPEEPIEHM